MDGHRKSALGGTIVPASPARWKGAARRLCLVLAAIACAAPVSACGPLVPDANAGPNPRGGYFGGS
jgi:hypothetical protein